MAWCAKRVSSRRHLADREAAQAGVGDAVGVGRLLKAVLLADLGADGLPHVPVAPSMGEHQVLHTMLLDEQASIGHMPL
jgi:hypothetical protein